MWEAIPYVTSGLTLVAFLAAIAAWACRRVVTRQERLIRTAPDQSRAQLVRDALEFFNVDPAGLTREQQYEIALRQINARAERFRITAIVVIIVTVLGGAVSGYAIFRTPVASPSGSGERAEKKPNPAGTKPPDPSDTRTSPTKEAPPSESRTPAVVPKPVASKAKEIVPPSSTSTPKENPIEGNSRSTSQDAPRNVVEPKPRPTKHATPATQYIILLDLSASVALEFPKYKISVQSSLEQLTNGDTVRIVGIIDDSYSNQQVLLEDRVVLGSRPPLLQSPDCSSFENRPLDKAACGATTRLNNTQWEQLARNHLKAERDRISSRWLALAPGLNPHHGNTDIIGALKYVERLLEDEADRAAIVCVYSDMRHRTATLDLETPRRVGPKELHLARQTRINLAGVTVRAYGVHTRMKDATYWESLRDFWRQVFRDSGATLDRYTVRLSTCQKS